MNMQELNLQEMTEVNGGLLGLPVNIVIGITAPGAAAGINVGELVDGLLGGLLNGLLG